MGLASRHNHVGVFERTPIPRGFIVFQEAINGVLVIMVMHTYLQMHEPVWRSRDRERR